MTGLSRCRTIWLSPPFFPSTGDTQEDREKSQLAAWPSINHSTLALKKVSNFCIVRYLKKAQCIIEQYGNYSIANLDNLPVSGVNTQVQVSP
jgi:hypothetical protein